MYRFIFVAISVIQLISVKAANLSVGIEKNNPIIEQCLTQKGDISDNSVIVNRKIDISKKIKKLQMRSATEIAKSITLGWNLGNSMEVGSGETAWGNPLTTKELILAVKNAGFTAVRIPCIWDAYTIKDDPEYTIQPERMARVKEVVDYCYNIGLYVMLNTHHDWLDYLFKKEITPEKEQVAMEKVTKIWGQIANQFKDYDDKLIFGFLNEADIKKEAMPTYMVLSQEFINVVRSSGGKNLGRTLVIQCPNTNIDRGYRYMEFPVDVVPDRMMTEVHYYSPWSFCGSSEGTYFWGKPYIGYGDYSKTEQEAYVDDQFKMMKERFVDLGIPVLLGEYGAVFGNGVYGSKKPLKDSVKQKIYEKSRIFFMKYVTKRAKDYGLVPFIWDDSWSFPLMDRKNYRVKQGHEADMRALLEGAAEGVYPY